MDIDRLKLRLLSSIGGLSSWLLVICIFSSMYYQESPAIVFNLGTIALVALLLDKMVLIYLANSQGELALLEANDLSYLRQTRNFVKDGKGVSQQLISVSGEASSKADNAYKRFHGFGRPFPARSMLFKYKPLDSTGFSKDQE